MYRLSDETAVVSTVDFITPPVDDPIWFGRIAAANSLSDVYAMGGRPIMALHLFMVPSKKLSLDILKGILQGGHEKVAEAGACLAGGHSVEDEEPKYGLAVTGVVHPDRILTNIGTRQGDALVLTKPLGSGVLFNARRSNKLSWNDLEPTLSEIAFLNRTALETALRYEVHACTDVTGFGLLGHSLEMARGDSLRLDIRYASLPFYSHAPEMYRLGETTGSNRANRELVQSVLQVDRKLSREQKELLFDPQTSGGLLISLPAVQADSLISDLRKAGVTGCAIVGEAIEARAPGLRIV